MYRNNNSRSQNFGGGRRFGGNNSGGNRGGGRGFGGGRGRKKSTLDPQRLIKAAIIKESVEDHYVPSFTFQDLGIDPQLKANVLSKGFNNPTPIQDKAIPEVLSGNDVVGIANTGTGKTGAFLIPAIEKILKDKRNRVLIIAPTRELADQIEHDAFIFTKNLNLRSLLVVGGANLNAQIGKLRSNPHILVGTPGRLLDLVDRRVLDLSTFSTIVLDEVDRMLDMGFVKDVKEIIANLPEKRQSLFFSATMTNEVENVLKIFSKNPTRISVKTGPTSDNIHQDIIEVKSREEKDEKLLELLRTDGFKKVIIFMRTKRGVQKLDDKLYDLGFAVASLHGNKSQPQRKRALDAFKQGKVNVLVATDVAARGLDVSDISHVINYDMPETYEDYAHRIGRTGRADKSGIALTFVDKF